jgi:ribosomal protein L7/L12
MKREDILKKLEQATDAQLEEVGKVFEPAAPAAAPAPAAPAPTAAPAAAKAPTFGELLAAADTDTRESIESGIRIAKEKKAAAIKTLKDTGKCSFSDEALNGMTQAQLDSLITLSGVNQPVDFAGMGAPRIPGGPQEAPAAPDLTAAIRAKQTATK